MNREEIKQYILDHSRDYFREDKSHNGYICPICQSGSHKNGTGITTKDGTHFTCWAGCFSNADIFDIIGLEHNTKDFNEQFKIACNAFRVEPTSNTTLKEQQRPTKKTEAPKMEEQDYTAFYKQAQENISNTDYAHKRGLTDETIKRFWLGYVENWKNPKNNYKAPTPRLIIPTSKYSYSARYTGAEENINRYEKVGQVHIFNSKALQSLEEPIFILEGEIDAMSVIEAGGNAIALGSTSNAKKLIETIKEDRPKQPLLLALDKDEAGAKKTKELEEALRTLQIPYSVADITGEYKDANEALVKDKEAFIKAVQSAIEEAKYIKSEAVEAEEELLRAESALGALDALKIKYETAEKPNVIPTGFSKLDETLQGGFRNWLYIMGAVSSLGKTSFMIQVADNIAKQGIPVLFISLEMAREELIAKCLSRLTYTQSIDKYGKWNYAQTTINVLNTDKYKNYGAEQREIIDGAIAEMETRGNNLIILEGVGNIGVQQIKEKVQSIKRIRGKAPVVFIDYLQILAPEGDGRGTDKQITDKAVLELKRLSRDEQTPVICISSFNRDNYREPVSLTSFKESGAIEYGSDVLIGLQYKGMDYNPEDTKDTKRRDRVQEILDKALEAGKSGQGQDIELKILKYRNGTKGKVNMQFVPMFNYFMQAVLEEEDEYKNWGSTESNYK